MVWVVDRRRREVAVHRLDGSGQLLFEDDLVSGEDVLPGCTLRVGESFA
jgi:Uma2 family endonuclease